ncbi:hypothetical protein F4808DRAFT_425225 [Astrocystis sublimbata]|nr:hypothetical protein F4808DRAFT_425225 [Astrocystis sublimbata]
MYIYSVAAALLLGAAMSAPTALTPKDQSRIYFTCNSSKGSGFSPKCCTDIDGQVGVNCVGAHIIGATNTYYECNLFVYNVTGCCQTTVSHCLSFLLSRLFPLQLFTCYVYLRAFTDVATNKQGFKNPTTNNTIDLCAMSYDPL